MNTETLFLLAISCISLGFMMGMAYYRDSVVVEQETIKDCSQDRLMIRSPCNAMLLNLSVEQLRLKAEYGHGVFDFSGPIDITYRIAERD
tara:strand:+ start:3291 stop:3560 length:270 start_codon:yes stop_codon:yes gene_type:complete